MMLGGVVAFCVDGSLNRSGVDVPDERRNVGPQYGQLGTPIAFDSHVVVGPRFIRERLLPSAWLPDALTCFFAASQLPRSSRRRPGGFNAAEKTGNREKSIASNLPSARRSLLLRRLVHVPPSAAHQGPACNSTLARAFPVVDHPSTRDIWHWIDQQQQEVRERMSEQAANVSATCPSTIW
eukprot:CAMPEP_0168789780 /NCGR_PEP_ID=MMETSP0725-20121227/13036_1 /TAXON_ID=265536 /ORGANISM="Amphiprora sp., Strain CCMP467" /LENGTH=180 /DNA_ID=CAMNT_0008840115 /DNA_START=915 /DNA_END=1455 /DNA_ORIENTATION=+